MSIKNNLIGNKSFYRKVTAIVLPIIIQNTVTNVVNLLDNVMVGQVGTLEMSAVAIVNQLIFVFSLCIFGGFAGAGIFVAQFSGAGDEKGVRHCFRLKMYMGIIMFVIACIIFLTIPKELISLYLAEDTSPEDTAATLKYGLEYLNIMLIGLFPFMLSQGYGTTLRETGETRIPMIASVSAIGINLVFNYLLIFGNFGFPELGVAGAAIATVMARFAEAIFIIIFTHVRHTEYKFIKSAYRSFRIPGRLLADVTKKGMPLLINEFLWSMGMATLLQCYSVRGIQVVAASNIASTVSNLFNVVFLSIGSAISILVGQQLGANKTYEAKLTVSRMLTLAVATCVITGGLMAALSPFIPQLYNTEAAVKSLATSFLLVFASVMPFLAFSHGCYFTLRSGGKTIVTFLFDSVFTWCVCVPVAHFLSNYTGLNILVVYGIVQSLEIIKCIVGFILIKKGVWINNIIEKNVMVELDF